MTTAHITDQIAAARRQGEKPRDAAMSDAERAHSREARKGGLKLLLVIRDRGEDKSDDNYNNLTAAAEPNETNCIGAAINGLLRAGVIWRAGDGKSKRAASLGSRIGRYLATCPALLAAKIREIEALLGRADATREISENRDSSSASAMPSKRSQPLLPIGDGAWMSTFLPNLMGG